FAVNGTLTENGTPSIPELQTRSFLVGSGSQDVTGTVELSPGDYGDVVVAPGATVMLDPGTYNFASLNIERDVNLQVDGTVDVNVQGDFQFGDRSNVIGGTLLTVYSNG